MKINMHLKIKIKIVQLPHRSVKFRVHQLQKEFCFFFLSNVALTSINTQENVFLKVATVLNSCKLNARREVGFIDLQKRKKKEKEKGKNKMF